jgi:hypothetical protein
MYFSEKTMKMRYVYLNSHLYFQKHNNVLVYQNKKIST